MAPTPVSAQSGSPTPRRVDWRWHFAALAALALGAGWNASGWLTEDRMPPGDFPGYAAQVQYVRDALLAHGRVPSWCVECYGGTTVFTGHLKEYLAFPLALAFDPVTATKLAFLILKIAGGWGLYALAARYFSAPAAGLVAGYALAFGAIANHQIEHLDVALAVALLPPLAMAAVELLRRGGLAMALALGGLAAAAFVNHWVHALTVPAVVIAAATSRAGLALEADPWRDRRLARRSGKQVAAALGVFFVLAGSQIAWIALDAENHRLIPASSTAAQRAIYIERSPFLFVNRDNALAPWLETHQPPGFDLPKWDGGRRYVGAVVLAVGVAGAIALRGARQAALRRWAALAGAMLWLQYWLSLGPRTLLWEIAESLHWSPAVQRAVQAALIVGSAACAALAVAHAVRARRGAEGAGRAARRALLASVLFAFPAASLWSACARLLPPLEVQRSPGHFFDVAPVWLYLLFAIALTALARRIARPRLRAILFAAIAAALLIDFAPSRRPFSAGLPMDPLRQVQAMLEGLPGEGGTLRIGHPIAYLPIVSWMVERSPAGYAWGWLPWQSGRHWADLVAGALYAASGPRPDGRGPLEPDPELTRAARIRYLLLDAGLPDPPDPWRRIGAQGRFAVWEQGGELPLARGYRSYVLLEGESRREAAIASRALSSGALAVSIVDSPGDTATLRRGASAIVRADRAPPDRFAPSRAPIAARAHRPAPERIEIEIDAGDAPAMVAISEGHHPWWRARVDGEPAPVLRANVAMLAVPVSAGAHRVELRLERPLFLVFADGLTTAGWIALCIALPTGLLIRSRAALGRSRSTHSSR